MYKLSLPVFSLVLMFAFQSSLKAQEFTLSSPDNQTKVFIQNKNELQFSIQRDDDFLVTSAKVDMIVNGAGLPVGKNKVIKNVKKSVSDVIKPVVAIKNSEIPDNYNEITLQFKEKVHVVFRAYNDAVAYRFETDYPDSVIVSGEKADFSFPKNTSGWFGFSDRWMNSYEHLYQKAALDTIYDDQTVELPVLLSLTSGKKVLITESDLYDYPGLYFKGNGDQSLHSIFPPKVKTERKNIRGEGGWDRIFRPASVDDYIAKTSGSRAFPWRIFAFADNDASLLNNEIVYKLASPSKVTDASWIKPGLVAWDWWNHWNVTDVNFKAGVNTDTYKYYIDFASQNHLPYIMMDEGWYQLGDMLKLSPDIDVREIVNYGKQKGVGVILWGVWRTLDQQMEQVLTQLESWGVKGIKIDFMNRDDQDVVNFYYRCAKSAAAHHLLVDFHGAHKPAGIQRTYPNVVNFEGVAGLENDKWTNKLATPWMAVTLPYIRMFAGPMDYTPGAMRNAQLKDFRPINDNPMSMGTRCQQLAMYVVYDAPLQMLADNPTAYNREKESLDFIAHTPTTWDQTIPLAGEVGEYLALARRKGDEYFVGAMTNWTARDLKINLSFLPSGASYKAVIFQDGINADRNATDYQRIERDVKSGDELDIHLAEGGGWVARIYKK